MPTFIPNEPQNGETVDADLLRENFAAVHAEATAPEADPVFAASEAAQLVPGDKAKLDSALQSGGQVGPAGLRIVGNSEGAETVGLVFLKSDGTTDSGYRLNYNDELEGVLFLRAGTELLALDASGARAFAAVVCQGAFTTHGPVQLLSLPVADPHVAGRLWNEAGTLKISAG